MVRNVSIALQIKGLQGASVEQVTAEAWGLANRMQSSVHVEISGVIAAVYPGDDPSKLALLVRRELAKPIDERVPMVNTLMR